MTGLRHQSENRENIYRLCVYSVHLYRFFPSAGDIGGSMGLFIGGSVLSIFEVFDVFLHHGARRALNR